MNGDPNQNTRESTVDAAFTRFYRAELDVQVRRCFLLLGSNEEANDVVHEAMVEIYERWGSIERPAAYLNRAVLNRCRDRGRRSGTSDRKRHLVAGGPAGPGDDAADRIAVDRALAGLPFSHRAALVLKFYSDLTNDQIADALGCRPGSVGPWISRGLAALQKELS